MNHYDDCDCACSRCHDRGCLKCDPVEADLYWEGHRPGDEDDYEGEA